MDAFEHKETVRQRIDAFEAAFDQITEWSEQADEKLITSFSNALFQVGEWERDGLDQLKLCASQSNKGYSQLERQSSYMQNTFKRIHQMPTSKKSCRKIACNYGHVSRLSQVKAVINFKKSDFSSSIPLISVLLPGLIPIKSHMGTSAVGQSICLHHPWVYCGFLKIDRSVESITKELESTTKQGLSLSFPWGLYIHPLTQNIYIMDRSNTAVLILDPEFQLLRRLNGSSAEYGWNLPADICIHHDGSVIAVTDQNNNRIHLLDGDGIPIKYLNHAEIKVPRFLTIDPLGFFYVANAEGKIVKFSKEGEITSIFGPASPTLNHRDVFGIVYDDHNRILLGVEGSSLVRVFDSDGNHLKDINIGTVGMNYLSRGPNGGFIVSDYGGSKIHFFTKDGERIKTLHANQPRAVKFDRLGRFYVVRCNDGYISRW